MEQPAKKDRILDATKRALRFLKLDPLANQNFNMNQTYQENKIKNERHEQAKVEDRSSYDFRPGTFDQMATGRFGEELAPHAAVWTMYLDEAQEHDNEMVKGRQQSLDTLLLFAALFSAVLTAFLIESKNLLQQDPGDASAALLLIIAQSQLAAH